MTSHRLASSPWGFRFTPLAEQCRCLRGLGMNHICGQFFAEMAGMLPPDAPDTVLAAARAEVGRHGLRYASFNATGDFMVAPDQVASEVAACCRQIDRAAPFQPEVIIVFAGWQERRDATVYEQVAASLKQVARHAAKHGLTVALENHGGLTATVEQVNRLIHAAAEPNLGLNYDPANFAMYGQDPLEALLRVEVPVVFTHLKSLRTINGKKEYCRLRDGEIDYLPILRRLAKSYTGFYALEYEDASDVVAGTRDDCDTLTRWWTEIQK